MVWHYTKRILSGLVITALLVMAASSLYVTQFRGGKFLSVQSASMIPTFSKGDLVEVNRVPYASLSVGDVITFKSAENNNALFTHRIIQAPTNQNSFKIVTKGDANQGPDMPIPVTSVLGKVSHSVPKLGFLVDIVTKPLGLLLLIYIPALSIVIGELKKLARHYKQQEPYRIVGYNRNTIELNIPKIPKPVIASGLFILLAPLAIAVPVRASLRSTATLAGSSLKTRAIIVPPTKANHILIRQLVLRCSVDNIEAAARRPRIVIYNPTKKPIVISGWHIDDNSGRMVTLPIGTTLGPNRQYVIAPLLRDTALYGLQFAGDNVTLRTAAGNTVDGLSWGSDTSQLNPALSAATPGTRYQRKPKKHDSNLASDFKISTKVCNNRSPGQVSTAPVVDENPGEQLPNEPTQPDQFILLEQPFIEAE